jgi:hypothetical protein
MDFHSFTTTICCPRGGSAQRGPSLLSLPIANGKPDNYGTGSGPTRLFPLFLPSVSSLCFSFFSNLCSPSFHWLECVSGACDVWKVVRLASPKAGNLYVRPTGRWLECRERGWLIHHAHKGQPKSNSVPGRSFWGQQPYI